jgi:PadR family transcriptional regulator AphA
MSLRYALLGLITLQPGTGYELTQRFDISLRNAWHASHSQIYPELAKLEAEGLAEVIEEGARRSKTYAATDQGRAELRRWLTETEPNRAQRNETLLRWFLVFLLEPDERRAVLEQELSVGEEGLRRRRELAAEMDAEGKRGGFRPLLDLGNRIETVIAEWLREQIERLRRREADQLIRRPGDADGIDAGLGMDVVVARARADRDLAERASPSRRHMGRFPEIAHTPGTDGVIRA